MSTLIQAHREFTKGAETNTPSQHTRAIRPNRDCSRM